MSKTARKPAAPVGPPELTDEVAGRMRVAEFASVVIEDSLFFDDPRCPFKATIYPGDPRLVVIVGENASGKSFLFRLMAQFAGADEEKITPVTVSIRERTDSSVPWRRAFMFGDEGQQSTGANSARVVRTGFKQFRDDSAVMLMLDEPEIGLSDGYARALGEFIGAQAAEPPLGSRGVVVVTHNRGLVRGIRSGLGALPTFVCMGDNPMAMLDWQASPDLRTVDDLFKLGDIALERRQATTAILNDLKSRKN